MLDDHLSFLTGEEAPVAVTEEPKTDSTPKQPNPENRETALEEIASLLTGDGEDEPKTATKRTQTPEPDVDDEADEDADDDTVASQPVIHSQQVMEAASYYGITPDEAKRFPTERALWGEIALRDRAIKREPAPEKETKDEDLPDFDFELEEDADPALAKLVNQFKNYTKTQKEFFTKKLSAAEEKAGRVEAEQLNAVRSQAAQADRAIAQMFDEKVAEWGDEMKELLGTPSKTILGKGSKGQQKEVQKLHNYVRVQLEGMKAMGVAPSLDDIPEILEQGKAALWREQVKRETREEITRKAKKTRGSVGLRPNSSRDTQVEQGDEPAKRSIAAFMDGLGGKSYAKK